MLYCLFGRRHIWKNVFWDCLVKDGFSRPKFRSIKGKMAIRKDKKVIRWWDLRSLEAGMIAGGNNKDIFSYDYCWKS